MPVEDELSNNRVKHHNGDERDSECGPINSNVKTLKPHKSILEAEYFVRAY